MSSKHWWPVHDTEEQEAVLRVLRSGKTNYYSGGEGCAFEEEWAAYVDCRHALTCSNGTTALELALHGLGIGGGMEVIVPARTFVATASAVVTAGAQPVVADIDEESLNVTVDTLEARRTPITRAVIVVHYAGRPCAMESICDWAWDKGLVVVEDCAHAHGARIDGRHVGTFGDVGTFSMCVGKIMSTGGEGGMVITDSSVIAKRMTQRRDHGRFQIAGAGDWRFRYTVDVAGSNMRLTEMQSAIGRCQLRKLEGWVARRREIAARYDEELKQRVLVPWHSMYLYLMRVQEWKRERLLTECWSAGVRWGGCGNILMEKAFAQYAVPCPQADAAGERVVSLPVYPTMTDDDVAAVCDAVRGVLG